jgi:hypothetical protein
LKDLNDGKIAPSMACKHWPPSWAESKTSRQKEIPTLIGLEAEPRDTRDRPSQNSNDVSVDAERSAREDGKVLQFLLNG